MALAFSFGVMEIAKEKEYGRKEKSRVFIIIQITIIVSMPNMKMERKMERV